MHTRAEGTSHPAGQAAQGQARQQREEGAGPEETRGEPPGELTSVSKDTLPVAQTVKNPPAMRGTWVRSLGQEDTMEKGMATHSSILAWRIPWREEPGRLQSTGS